MFWEKKQKGRSKEEEWNHYQLFDLFNDLDRTLNVLERENNSGNYSSKMEEFVNLYDEELTDLKYQNVPDFKLIIEWFSLDTNWVSILNLEEKGLSDRICERATRWNEAMKEYLN